MAPLSQRTWVWASSRRWWRTGKPGVLQSWGCKQSDETEAVSIAQKKRKAAILKYTWPLLLFSTRLSLKTNYLTPPHNWLQLRSGRTAISNPSGSNLPHEVREIARPSPLWHSCLTWCKGEGFVKVLEPRYHFSQRLRLTHGTVVCFPSSHKLSPHQKWSCKIARACYQKNSRPQTLFQKTSLGKPKENRGTKTETSDVIFISDIKSYCHQ